MCARKSGIIASAVIDGHVGGRALLRGRGAARVEVDPDELDRLAAFACPACNRPQHVAVTKAHIENTDRTGHRVMPGRDFVQEIDRRPPCQRQRVHPRQIMDDGGIGRCVEIIGIHQLLGDGAHGKH